MRRLLLLALVSACAPSNSGGTVSRGDGGGRRGDAGAQDLATVDLATVDLANVDLAGSPCPIGSSLVTRRTCVATASAAPSTLKSECLAATRGDTIDAPAAEGQLPCLPTRVCRPDDAPTLIFSDEPESPATSGVLYAASVNAGRYRVYVYHTNGAASGTRKFSLVALAPGQSDVTMTFGARGVAGPSTTYIATGRAAASAWLTSSTGSMLTVPSGQRVVVDQGLDALRPAPGELVVAQLDFSIDGPLKLSVVTVDASTDAAQATAGLSLLPNDGAHQRGTFPGADFLLVPDTDDGTWPSDGMRHLRLGSGDTDPELVGIDAVDGNTAVALLGNYGVRYRVAVAGGPFLFALSPRGGAWGGAARVPPGLDSSATVPLLPGNGSSIASTSSMTVLGRWGTATSSVLDLFSAGGSNLPVDLVSVPLQ
ncbi:MAG: hypothetical protein ABI321_05225 [Polyangia bacterium]